MDESERTRWRRCEVDRQGLASRAQFNAGVDSPGGCLRNSEELVPPETFHADGQLGRCRLPASRVPSNRHPAVAVRQWLKRKRGVRKNLPESKQIDLACTRTLTYGHPARHEIANADQSRRTLDR